MTFSVTVDFPVDPAAAFALLADPVRRPAWQSSLRRVTLLTEDPLGLGTRWIDHTWAGPAPTMEITCFDPGVRWSERGSWRGLVVDLVLDLTPGLGAAAGGTTITATTTTYAAGLWRPAGGLLELLGPRVARDDLRRAARLTAGG
ncbi:SRPBCC family protein [Nocardioides sp. AE5]|uniref:SRPBCC family protein n=1 Tax=Nocardioides sp. AE5 TaxID=2962573 RepID=UPI002881AC14|nr:SRPBCC family protein [Nocardioides sp. AE5]MDT0203093.1 SRPBCC family protein [Nocardioides sp. AE5]